LIEYCYDLLRRKGYKVERFVETGINGKSLRADLVTRTTVYEFRETLAKTPLLAGMGQGLVYAWWLRRRRVVVVGYLPLAAVELGDALTTIENIERTGYVKISVVDQDPFWGLVPISYRWLGYTAILTGAIALTALAIPLFKKEVGCRVYPELPVCAVDRVYQP
jgi:hypothetical protein